MTASRKINIKLTPKASSDRIGDIRPGTDGAAVLTVYVTAVPENGKANAAMIALLAKSWRLPKSAFAIVTGETSRLKRVRIAGNAQILLRNIAARIEAA